ncbi:MAG: tyrosine-type recombinase/integrase [Propionicimonas sp.]|uniref:tyrosine-type recombinase/integrase n=1 Tax=Propionicimonas sp. TaxID=1955623 RepID=UPI002B1FBAEF|nr:tyrosine-type recombinase/integrase [Propionicimonas sp.]MEA4944528.1 tyrosine-type recombinase/integrase [Propionicimonas sp.]
MARTTTKRRTPGPLGTVEKLPSGRFRAFYRHEGTKYPAPHTFTTREAAQGWLATERADRRLGTWRDPKLGQITLTEYARSWLDSRTDLASRTRHLYGHLLDRRVLPAVNADAGGRLALGRLALVALTPALVRQWFALMSADCARDARRPRRRPDGAGSTHGPNPVRAWAIANGHRVAAQGRLPQAVLDAWKAAGSPTDDDQPARPTHTGQTTAAQSYRLLHAILAAAVIDGLLTSNPARITGGGIVRHAERETASPDEVAALAEGMPANLRAAVWLAAWSGLRRGELLGLARRHVDLEAGSVRVERTLDRAGTLGPTKTRASVRTVYLPAFVVEHLANHMETFTKAEPDALVFTNAAGGPVYASHLLYAFQRARLAIGRPGLTWHDLRHTGATLAYQAGGSVRDVQRRLGHATVRAAMIYAHAADDSDRHLAGRLNAAFGPTDPQPPTPTPQRPEPAAPATAPSAARRHLRAVPNPSERRAS